MKKKRARIGKKKNVDHGENMGVGKKKKKRMKWPVVGRKEIQKKSRAWAGHWWVNGGAPDGLGGGEGREGVPAVHHTNVRGGEPKNY